MKDDPSGFVPATDGLQTPARMALVWPASKWEYSGSCYLDGLGCRGDSAVDMAPPVAYGDILALCAMGCLEQSINVGSTRLARYMGLGDCSDRGQRHAGSCIAPPTPSPLSSHGPAGPRTLVAPTKAPREALATDSESSLTMHVRVGD